MIEHTGVHEGERGVLDCAGKAAIAERSIAAAQRRLRALPRAVAWTYRDAYPFNPGAAARAIERTIWTP